jgi:hypothetical protein
MKILALPLALLLAGTASAEEVENPYGAPPAEGSPQRLRHDALFGEPGSLGAIAGWLAANFDAPTEDRARLWETLCELYAVRSWNALRSEACAEADRLDPEASADTRDGGDAAGMAAVLRDSPPIRAVGSTTIPLVDSGLGVLSGEVTVNGQSALVIMDTGAEIAVLSQSLADRMGIRYLGDPVRVGTSTTPVSGRVAMIDLMRIGDAYVENVPVFVLPDAQLTIANFPTIPGILSLPVFAAFGRMAWLDGGQRLAFGDEAPLAEGRTERIYWHDSGLGIPIRTRRGVMGAHFDSGANRTSLHTNAERLLSEEELASAATGTLRVGGAGGVVEREVREFPVLTLSIAGLDARLSRVTLAEQSGYDVARIGNDLILQSRRLVLDFERMLIAAEPPTAEAPED